MVMEIMLTVLISMLMLLVLHWIPWPLVIGKELPKTAAYALGVLGMIVPLTGLFLYWHLTETGTLVLGIIALWSDAVFGGLAVFAAYFVDDLGSTKAENRVAKSEGEKLRNQVMGNGALK